MTLAYPLRHSHARVTGHVSRRGRATHPMSERPAPGRTASGRDPDLYTVSRRQGAEAYQRIARKNLAALICERHGVDPTAEVTSDSRTHLTAVASEFASLTDILGLDSTPSTPLGCCPRCGEQLSLSVSRDHLRHDRGAEQHHCHETGTPYRRQTKTAAR